MIETIMYRARRTPIYDYSPRNYALQARINAGPFPFTVSNYAYWRRHGHTAHDARDLAVAERFAFDHDLSAEFRPDEEPAQCFCDDQRCKFRTPQDAVGIVLRDGASVIDSLWGIFASEADDPMWSRWHKANMVCENMRELVERFGTLGIVAGPVDSA